jgi:cytidylate kinase
VIAIDGPAGAGKSTVARAVARRLGYVYLDTGAMYRAVTLEFQRRDVRLDRPRAVRLALARIRIEFDEQGNLLLNGNDVEPRLRSRRVTRAVSAVAAHPAVRRRLVRLQRAIARGSPGVVVEGRDTTTVVFPRADVKIFLEASLAERARRRARELRASGERADVSRVRREMSERDRKDSRRAHSPLRRAPDAFLLDTTRLSLPSVVRRVLEEVARAGERAGRRVRSPRRRDLRRGK